MSILSATYISEASQEFCCLVFIIILLSIISTILQIVLHYFTEKLIHQGHIALGLESHVDQPDSQHTKCDAR